MMSFGYLYHLLKLIPIREQKCKDFKHLVIEFLVPAQQKRLGANPITQILFQSDKNLLLIPSSELFQFIPDTILVRTKLK